MAHFDDQNYAPPEPAKLRHDPLVLWLVLISGAACLLAYGLLAIPHIMGWW